MQESGIKTGILNSGEVSIFSSLWSVFSPYHCNTYRWLITGGAVKTPTTGKFQFVRIYNLNFQPSILILGS